MNTICWKRDNAIGERFEASARYASEDDGWYCSVGRRERGTFILLERRGPVSDAWAELSDMMELAITDSYAVVK